MEMDAGDARATAPGVAKAMTPKTSTLRTNDSGTHAREHASARKGSTAHRGTRIHTDRIGPRDVTQFLSSLFGFKSQSIHSLRGHAHDEPPSAGKGRERDESPSGPHTE